MGQTAKRIDEVEEALRRRVNAIVEAYGGNPKAALETVLMVIDARATATSYGYVRGCAPGGALIGDDE